MTALEQIQRKAMKWQADVLDLRELAAVSVGRGFITPTEGAGLMRTLEVFIRLINQYEDEELAQLPQEKGL